MKRIFITTTLFAALAVLFTSCLKDKGFDNGTYGINDPDTQPPGVGFPRAATAKFTVGINLSAAPQAIDGVVFGIISTPVYPPLDAAREPLTKSSL